MQCFSDKSFQCETVFLQHFLDRYSQHAMLLRLHPSIVLMASTYHSKKLKSGKNKTSLLKLLLRIFIALKVEHARAHTHTCTFLVTIFLTICRGCRISYLIHPLDSRDETLIDMRQASTLILLYICTLVKITVLCSCNYI